MNCSRIIGIDLSKRGYVAFARSKNGAEERWVGGSDRSGRHALNEKLKAGDVVAMEAGTNAFTIARSIKNVPGVRVFVLNPLKLSLIFSSVKKTDREDAKKLAKLVSMMDEDDLPTVVVPSVHEEEMRRLASGEVFLKQERTRLVNRLHALCANAGFPMVRKKDLATAKKRSAVLEQLSGVYRLLANQMVAILTTVDNEIECIQNKLQEELMGENEEDVTILFSIPGVGPSTAAAYLGYVGRGERFSSASQIGHYVGLVPRIDISGTIEHYGGITKQGSTVVRRALTQAAWTLIRVPEGGALRETYFRLKERIGASKAIVAIARKLAELMWALLKKRQLYSYSTLEQRLRKAKHYKMQLSY